MKNREKIDSKSRSLMRLTIERNKCLVKQDYKGVKEIDGQFECALMTK